MTVIKGKHESNFSIIANEVFDDERLSFEAMGLLAWLRSRPGNWTLVVDFISKRFGLGRGKTYRLVSELVEAGWIDRQQVRVGGVIRGWEYTVLREPRDGIREVVDPPRVGFTTSGKPTRITRTQPLTSKATRTDDSGRGESHVPTHAPTRGIVGQPWKGLRPRPAASEPDPLLDWDFPDTSKRH